MHCKSFYFYVIFEDRYDEILDETSRVCKYFGKQIIWLITEKVLIMELILISFWTIVVNRFVVKVSLRNKRKIFNHILRFYTTKPFILNGDSKTIPIISWITFYFLQNFFRQISYLGIFLDFSRATKILSHELATITFM